MKKLKVLLVVLLAGLMSLALFACKKNKPQEEGPSNIDQPTGSEIVSVTPLTDPIEFTEKATASDLAAEVAKVSIRVRTGEGAQTIKGDACTIEDATNIQWGTVGSYNVNLLPTENNTLACFTRLVVNIVHDFDNEGVCKDCQAAISTTEIGDEGTPETVKFIAFHDNGHTLTEGSESFVTRYEYAPTYTAGRLTKGTKIVLKGTAQSSDVDGATWNFPVVGFADSALGEYAVGADTGSGTSVLIRNDSWILLNGIGTPRMLGGLAGGTSESKNYGSTTDGTAQPSDYLDWTEGTRYSEGVPYTTANWKDWYTYSTGTVLYSQDYASEVPVEITWEYRYDGVIVVSICTNDDSTLTAYTKVPDNSQGYYDAILHGEKMVYKLTSMTMLTPLTLTDMQVSATPKDKNTKGYLANQMLSFDDLAVQAKYQQKGDVWQNVDQFEVYGMVEGTGTQTMTVGEATYTGTLYNLSNSPLLSAMTRYFVVLGVGKVTKTVTFEAADFIQVYANAVDSITAYSGIGAMSFVENANGTDAYEHTGSGNVTLKIKGSAGTIEADSNISDIFSETTDTHFIAFILGTKDGGDKFTVPAGLQNNMITGDRYMAQIAPDGSMMYVMVTMKKGDLPTVELTGLQDGKITLDLSAISGLDATSAVTLPENFALNEGGVVSVVYEFAAGTIDNATRFMVEYAGGGSFQFRLNNADQSNGNVAITAITDKDGAAISDLAAATSLKITMKIAGTSLNAAIGDYDLQLYKSGNVLARTAFTYQPKFNDSVTGDKGAVIVVSEDESSVGTGASWYTQRVGDTLYVAKVFNAYNSIESEDIVVNDFTLNFNAGDQDKVVYFDLSGYWQYGAYVFNNKAFNDEEYEGMTVALYVNGTLDYESDWDNYAVLVFAIDLSELEDQVVEGVYNFAHTDLYQNGDNYYYYSATANGVETKTVEKSAAATSGIKSDCETAGATLTGIKSGENYTFLIHVDYTPQHSYEKDAKDFYICEDDGAVLWSGNAMNMNVKASYFADMLTANEATSLVETGLTVSFAMQAENKSLSDWNAAVLSTSGMIITTPNLDCWGASAGKSGTDEMKALATKLATANVYPGFNGNDNLQNSYAWDAFLGEKCYVTIVISKTAGISYYRNGELAIRYNPDDYLNRGNTGNVDEAVNAQVKHFAELILFDIQTYGVTVGSGSTVQAFEDILFEARTANDEACEKLYINYNRSNTFYPEDGERGGIYSEIQEPTAQNPLVIEADGYTGTSPLWIGEPIQLGKVVTFTGTMESTGGTVYYLPIVYLFSSDSAAKGSMFRLDDYAMLTEAGTKTSHVSVTLDGTATTIAGMKNPAWTEMLAASPVAEIQISWLNPAKITITFKMTATIEETEHVAISTFEMAAAEGNFTQTAFNIGLGGEKMTYTITSITRVDGETHEHSYDATTGDCSCGAHQHVFTAETDRCAKDGALKPGHEHSYDATTELCRCGELNPEHLHKYGSNGVCPLDGALDPSHEHSFTEGVCVCGAQKGALDINVNATGWNSQMYTNVLKQNGVLTVTGSQVAPRATELNDRGDPQVWLSFVFEFAEGYTGRTDNYGWTFDAEKLGGTGNWGVATIADASGANVTMDWKIAGEIAKKCDWTITLAWTDAGVVVTLKMTATSEDQYAGYVYTCTGTLALNDSSLTELHVRFGAEGATETFTGYELYTPAAKTSGSTESND